MTAAEERVADTLADVLIELAFMVEPGTDLRGSFMQKFFDYTTAVRDFAVEEVTNHIMDKVLERQNAAANWINSSAAAQLIADVRAARERSDAKSRQMLERARG